MNYYFPIYINSRRIHICNLQEKRNSGTPFEFIIHKAERTVIFSIPVQGAKLLSSEGYKGKKGNVQLNKVTPVLTYNPQLEECQLDLYDSDFKMNTVNGLGSPVVIQNWGKRNCAVMIDRTKMKANTSFTFTICYHHAEKVGKDKKVLSERVFSYSFTIHYCEKKFVKQAALDFGSEASQARVEGDRINLQLVDLMKDLLPPAPNGETDYWQRNRTDEFFKSVFFLCTEPTRPIEEADKPNLHNDKTFVRTLVDKSDPLENQFILPNLKLLDALSDNIHLNRHNITLNSLSANDTDAIVRRGIVGRYISLGTAGISDLILEILLNNFMHCILHQLETNLTDTFLRLNILMPNVYPQDKVYRVVQGLYAGFNAMKNKYTEYDRFKGIEIQVLSESDAAFLGTRTTDPRQAPLINKEGGYFLIIDAGKGTTDFSILRQQIDHTVFDSVYRSGIPISGNYITYAFYESVRDLFNQHGYTLNDKLSDASTEDTSTKNKNRTALLEFVDCLEQLKRNYDTFKQSTTKPIITSKTALDLTKINAIINTEILQKKGELPGIEDKVNDAVNKIVEEVAAELNRYCINHPMKFVQVMFTGRGFLFRPLREAMETKLKEMKLMEEKEKVLCFDDENLSKSICLKGAFLLENSNRINQNSEMVGFPVVDSQSSGFWSKLWEMFFGGKHVDEKFFYSGIRIQTPQPAFYVSGYEYHTAGNNPQEKRLLFVGDGFMLQHANSSEFFQNAAIQNARNDDVNRSLFPFFEGSIPKKEEGIEEQTTSKNDTTASGTEPEQPSNTAANTPVIDIINTFNTTPAEESGDTSTNNDVF